MQHRLSIKGLLVLLALVVTLVTVFILGIMHEQKIQEAVSQRTQEINSENLNQQREEAIITKFT